MKNYNIKPRLYSQTAPNFTRLLTSQCVASLPGRSIKGV